MAESDSYPDLPAAAVAWLRADAGVVAAFSEDTSAPATTKLWADHAEGSPSPPYLVYEEVDELETYETPADGQDLIANAEGHVEAHIYASTKGQARTLGNLVAASLQDAPLAFACGELLWLRVSGQWFEEDDELGVGVPIEFHRVIEFRYLASRSI